MRGERRLDEKGGNEGLICHHINVIKIMHSKKNINGAINQESGAKWGIRARYK